MSDRRTLAIVMGAAALVLVVVGVLLAVAGAGSASPAEAARAECDDARASCVVVGVGQAINIGTLLFEDDPTGLDEKRAAEMAVDYLDGVFDGIDGTLLGHAVNVVDEVEDCTRRGGIAGAKRLLLQTDLVGVIGTTCSGAAFHAAARVLSRRSVVLISPSNTSPVLTDSGAHERFYFRTAFNDLIQGAVVAEFARVRLGARTAGVIASPDAYSHELGKAFASAFAQAEGVVTADASMRVDGPAAPAVARLAANPPQVAFLPLFEPACSRAVTAIRATPSLARTRVVVGESCQSPEIFARAGRAAIGVYASGPDASDRSRSAFYRDFFVPAYRERYGELPVEVFHASAFDAMNLLLGAVRRAAVRLPGGSLVIDRGKVRRAMLDVHGYRGLSGILTCVPTGDCAQSARIAIYRAPNWPVLREKAKPVFSQSLTLAEVTGQG